MRRTQSVRERLATGMRQPGVLPLAVTLMALILLVVLVNVYSRSTINHDMYSTHVPAADIEALKAQVARDYPGWTIEHVYVGGDPGNLIFYQNAKVVVQLKWPGPQDFRLARGFYYGSSPPNPEWAKSPPDLFQSESDRAEARAFINAFKAKHPEPGWVVGGVGALTTSVIKGAGPAGDRVGVWYLSLGQMTSSNGGLLGRPSEEVWKATATNGVTTWQFLVGE